MLFVSISFARLLVTYGLFYAVVINVITHDHNWRGAFSVENFAWPCPTREIDLLLRRQFQQPVTIDKKGTQLKTLGEIAAHERHEFVVVYMRRMIQNSLLLFRIISDSTRYLQVSAAAPMQRRPRR